MADATDRELIQALEADAAIGWSSSTSDAFHAAMRRGPALVPELERAIADPERRHRYLILVAIRQLSRPTYQALDPELRAGVYAAALRTMQDFDDFGLPDSPSKSSRALVELGGAAEKPLRALLDDRKEVRAMDGELNSLLKADRVRVCDYALCLLLFIRGEREPLSHSRSKRDARIAELKREQR